MPIPHERLDFYLEHMQMSVGPKWEGEIIIVTDEAPIRLATETEIQEAAEEMPWVRNWLDEQER